jgi:phasin family protein
MKPRTIEAAQAAGDTAQEARIEAGAAVAKTIDTAASNIRTGVATATAGIQQTQERVKNQMDKVVRTAEELVSFGQGNLEAVMKSSQIWLAGVQDLTKQVATSAQEQVDATVSALRALGTVRSPKEALELQTNLARSSFEKAVNETRRLSDSSYKLAEQAVAPIAARVTLAFEKFGRVPA